MSKKKQVFKKSIRKLHLWLGLAVGIIVFIVSITGAMYVFKEDIQNYLRKDVIYHHEEDITHKEPLSLSVLQQKVNEQTKIPYPIHYARIPLDKNRSYQFVYHEMNDKAWNYFDEYIIYKTAYVNPYTGKVLKVYDEKNGFFNIVKFIHWSLLLNHEWGTYVVGIPTLIFVFMLISGLILWWPKNKKGLKVKLRFRWKNIKNWRRKNYDLHSILGFYASFIAFIVAITGLFYAFFFMKAIIYFIFSGGETEYPYFTEYKTTAPIEMRDEYTLDRITKQVEKEYPNAYGYSVDLGNEHLNEHKHPNFSVYVFDLPGVYYKRNQLIFDENSGELLKIHDYSDKNFGEKTLDANYDIHTGAILGLGTKILAFIVSLICASLPITGFLIWIGRKRKK